MMEMMVMLASIMSTEQCIDRLQKSIDEYKEAELLNSENQKDKKAELLLSCHLLTLHITNSKKGLDGAMHTIEKLKEIEKAHNFFKTEKN